MRPVDDVVGTTEESRHGNIRIWFKCNYRFEEVCTSLAPNNIINKGSIDE